MSAYFRLLVEDQEEILEVAGPDIPDVDDGLIGELEDMPDVAWASRGYGNDWLVVPAEKLRPLKARDLVARIRVKLGRRGVVLKRP